jgi:Zyg-11 family protein
MRVSPHVAWYGNFTNMLLFLQTFPQREELLRNMMGLLGNVAEVQMLRQRLMTSQFVSVFADLLDAGSEGIEVNQR